MVHGDAKKRYDLEDREWPAILHTSALIDPVLSCEEGWKLVVPEELRELDTSG